MKVLVVDDVATQRLLLLKWLQEMQHEVVTATNGVEGIAAFERARPDIVLLDKVMPEMDGIETARRILALGGPWVPIIFISANDAPEEISEAIEAGGDDYLIKPINKIVLAAKMLAMQRIVAMKTVMASPLPAYIDQELQRLTELDGTTGLANRFGFDRSLAREYARCSRASRPISILVTQVGDWLSADPHKEAWTKKLSTVFKSHITRSPDLLAHLGNGHFCSILPDTPLTGALHLVEQIHRTIAELHGADKGQGAPVRFGIATHVPESDRDYNTLLDAAEHALNQAQAQQEAFACAEQTPLKLTPRELECLQWCALGKSSWEVARLLNISEAAVNFHVSNVRAKCGVSTRRQAIAKALRLGLIRQN